MDFYYFDADQRRGPVNAAQLRALAANGIITPETTIEAGGRTLPARRIKGLEFAPADPPAVYPVEEPAPEPAPAPEPVIVKPREPDPPQPSPQDKKRAAARASLDWWVSSLTAIGWFEILVGAVGGGICFTQGDRDDSFIIAGFASIIGGVASAILPLAIASIGRFMLTHHD